MPRIDRDRDAFLAIDLQNDFCAGGALAVPDGDAVLEPVNRLMALFIHVVATQDWHPADHASFAANHPGAAPFSSIDMPYGRQTLWPVHCVQATPGAGVSPRLRARPRHARSSARVFARHVDSYSAFFENDRTTPTGLAGLLRERGVTRVFLAGLATDFCVSFSALDARRLGFDATVVTRRLPRHRPRRLACAAARAAWGQAGVAVIESGDLG